MTPTTSAAVPVARTEESPDPEEATEVERAKNYSFTLLPSLMERTRSAQWHTNSRPDGHQTVSAMVRELLLEEVERLEQTYNRGRPFPPVAGRLPSGPGPEGAVRGAQLRARNRKRKAEEEGQGGDSA